MKSRKIIILSLVVCISLLCSGVAFASSLDINGHWAERDIITWENSNLIKGYDDGTFKPDNNITRAEFVTLVNRVFEFTKEAQVNFSDVSSGDWFVKEIAKAQAQGYITGYEDGTIKPNNPITREEVAAIIFKLVKLTPPGNMDALNKFVDASKIPDWSRNYINAVVVNGYMSGYEDNTCQPEKSITRAESVTILNRVIEKNLNKVETPEVSVITGSAVLPGTVSGSVKINYIPSNGNSLRYVKQSAIFDTPKMNTDASNIGSIYVLGSDILDATSGERIGLYEVDKDNKVVGFVCFTLSSGDIASTQTDSLTGLILSGNPMNYSFDKNIVVYHGVMVPNEAESITITPTGAGMITVDGIEVKSGTASNPIALTTGVEKDIVVKITENGKEPKTITIKVTRQIPRVTDLTGLIISGNPSNFNFRGETYHYEGVTVDSSVGGITVIPIGLGTITVGEEDNAVAGVNAGDKERQVVKSGTASQPIQLTIGVKKTIAVTVTESGKMSKTYIIEVTRK